MNDDTDWDPVCLHKGGDPRVGRTGLICPTCGYIRHRHSRLWFSPVLVAGGITVLTTVVVPLSEAAWEATA